MHKPHSECNLHLHVWENMHRDRIKYGIILLILLFQLSNSFAQYFGQNKPQYKQFNFELYNTPHFELYHYFYSDTLIQNLSQQSEVWYQYHQQVFRDSFNIRNPIIFYSNHADFQQTTAISSHISVGTGGVTEGIKRRIVMPVNFSAQETNHVLGHEMVHAFQYHLLQYETNLGISAVQNIPLWMIEGMAEYLSKGNTDSHTALWMRDALIHKHFPSLKQMTVNYTYSPYRYGQAFWSYIAYTYGEQYIRHLLLETANKGIEQAISDVFLVSMDSLSVLWKNELHHHLLKNINDSTFSVHGDRIISHKNSGRYNLSPSVSPDGKKLIYLSERDLFSLDLYMANAETGELIKKLYSSTYSDDIDAISFLETAGSWSNDSRHFAYVAYTKGQSAFIIFDTETAKIVEIISFPDIDGIGFPAWSPNGESIAFTGLKNGVSDLYLYQLKNNQLQNITNDTYCNLQPNWNKSGHILYYTTDEPYPTQINLNRNFYNIASYNLKTGTHQVFDTFDGAQNMNPVIGDQAHHLFFLSDRDGTRNLYQINTEENTISQLTQYPTGITGMTHLSPALTTSGSNLYYNMLWEGRFSILKANIPQIQKTGTIIENHSVNNYASRLMPYSKFPSDVDYNLASATKEVNSSIDSFYKEKVQSKFKLDYIGNTSTGIMTSRYGTGMAGSIEARFSDIFGEHILYSGVSINGEIYDFGAQVAYINQKKPIKLGTSLSHIPYRTGYFISESDETNGSSEISYLFQRTFVDKLSFFGFYPLNKAHRIEAGIAAAYYSYRTEKIHNPNSIYTSYRSDRKLISSPSAFTVGIIDAAYVIDNSKFGLASPIEGKRIRIGYERYFHGVNMNALLLDYRKYFNFKPYTLGFRFYHYGRYGKESDSNRLISMFIGYPWYIRGYEAGNFYGSEEEGKISTNQLLGSKIIVSNVEWRIPFTGPRNYAWIKSRFLFSELALFYDAGIAWDRYSSPSFNLTTSELSKRIPLMSTGAALRFNLLGAIIVEPYYAFPIHQGKVHTGNLGINILSGW